MLINLLQRLRLQEWINTSIPTLQQVKIFLIIKQPLTFKMSDVFHTRKANYTSTEANAITNREVLFKTRYLLTFTYRFNKASKRNANNRSKDINKDVFEIKEKLK